MANLIWLGGTATRDIREPMKGSLRCMKGLRSWVPRCGIGFEKMGTEMHGGFTEMRDELKQVNRSLETLPERTCQGV